ncbi:hypothetical protein SLEP1_g33386 [Rubroshorea leprosula]|uniref:Reverse transcriptase Ty1/copia-type domain-containing protein n=1 Tax=Rubroshorea leprosula TaxID=152421 RepID=A0AAV5KGM6_9ROSI|nr:hypothetical protein SLEP1_g33386 [Rubroshorea leprosula]
MQQPASFVDPRFPDYGFSQSQSDASLFIYHHGSTWIYFLVYVDGIIITGNDPCAVQSIIQVMGASFSLKDFGPPSFFLRVEAIPTTAGLLLSQHQYIINLLHQYNMHEAKPVTTPLAVSLPCIPILSTSSLRLYISPRMLIGRLQNVFFDTYVEQVFMAYYYALSVLYLYMPTPMPTRLAIHLLVSIPLLGVSGLGSPVLFCDNVGATYLSLNPVLHSRMKHIAIDLHFVRDLVDQKLLHVSHISSHDQLADGLTKALSTARSSNLHSKIGVADGTSILQGRVKEGVSPT